MAFGRKTEKKVEKPKETTTAKVQVKEEVKPKAAPKPRITNVYSADFSVIDETIEVTMAIPADKKTGCKCICLQ